MPIAKSWRKLSCSYKKPSRSGIHPESRRHTQRSPIANANLVTLSTSSAPVRPILMELWWVYTASSLSHNRTNEWTCPGTLRANDLRESNSTDTLVQFMATSAAVVEVSVLQNPNATPSLQIGWWYSNNPWVEVTINPRISAICEWPHKLLVCAQL